MAKLQQSSIDLVKTSSNTSDTPIAINMERSRDDLLTSFGKAVLKDRYLFKSEDFQQMFARVAAAYADDSDHAQRLYDYISKHWFMPATPILSNGGTEKFSDNGKSRGLPISCFLNESPDSLEGIVQNWNENVWLASRGGGIGTYWGNVRSIGEPVSNNGKSSGVIPFLKVQDSQTLAISQGSLRRGSSAAYMPINHPEIEEFIELRRPTGGDPNRKALNIHHGVCITDDFMRAVEKGLPWDLVSPCDGAVMHTVSARDLWVRLLTARMETGEPYILFIDTVNNYTPEHHKKLGLHVKTSNLCSEITLPTGTDHLGKERTAVCCLSSLNLEYYEEWVKEPRFIEDVMRFLDNVLSSFIEKAGPGMENAVYSAERERSVGLGVMGFHSLLQSKLIPFESVMAKVWNKKIFEHIKRESDLASRKLALERGPCPDAAEVNIMERFSNKLAIAPTASISVIAGNSSPGIEPYMANSFTQKTLSGSFNVRNKHLVKLLESKNMNTEQVWSSITTNEGSVQHLSFLDENEKDVFKTAQELEQRWLLEHAADRTPFICQAQSLNIFLPGDVHKKVLHEIHYQAWKKGIKSLYYLRSTSLQRSDKVSHSVEHQCMDEILAANSLQNSEQKTEGVANSNQLENYPMVGGGKPEYEECLACQ